MGDGEHRFNDVFMGSLMAALKTVQEDPDVGSLVTTNEGKFYSNGLDTKSTLSPKAYKDTCLLAKKLTTSEAYALGIVDSAPENAAATLEAAIALATELSRKDWDRNFYRNFRLDLRPRLLHSPLERRGSPSQQNLKGLS
ncbi:hypothetical protein R1flu_017842 [Riccia fluitans]|uniref:Uncharacterized protein n=1 Tax=Riccia fluitans TaxID=41844 RepID=A0ABD1ZI37_9MARC